ncbi:type II toxin-antitoxin system RelB/DinJ family antitoxin [Erwinia sp. STN24]|uniref:type II toxin-antitoxin system RelB/DinJ family antitoxin n=1 Tax=Erwinia sp. STN24 TaxID=3233996 RepID=UPI003522BAC9
MKSITVRLDDELKAQAEAVLEHLGVSSTQAITHLYLYLAQHGQLPYRIRPVAESPEDVYRATLHRVRAVTGLLTTVAALPADAVERRDLTELCSVRCLRLRQDIAGNAPFLAAAICTDPLPRTDGEDAGLYWRWIGENLARAENAIDQAAPDMNATLTAVAGQLTGYYWQLATYTDQYEINETAVPFEYDRDAAHAGHTLYSGKIK